MYRAATSYLTVIVFIFSFVLIASIETFAQESFAKAEDLNRQAILRIQEAKYDQAIPLLTKAIAVEPKFAEGHLNLGSAHMLAGSPKDAIDHLKRGIELDPASPEGFNQLGVAYEKMGKLDKAIEAFEKATALKTDYALGNFNLGAAYLWAGKLKPAQQTLERAVQLNPKNNDARLCLAVVYAKQKRYKQAIEEVREVTRRQPNDEQANLILLKIHLLADDRQAALGMYHSFKAVNDVLAEQMFRSLFSEKVISVSGLMRR